MFAATRPHLVSSSTLAASTSSSTSAQSLTSRLIASALPHIPAHGFTPSAVLAGARASESQLKAPLDDPTMQKLFPGGCTSETAIPLRLLKRWDAVQLNEMRRQYEVTKGANSQSGGGVIGLQSGHGGKGTFHDAVALLEKRLAESDRVKTHLLEVSRSTFSSHPLKRPQILIAYQPRHPLSDRSSPTYPPILFLCRSCRSSLAFYLCH